MEQGKQSEHTQQVSQAAQTAKPESSNLRDNSSVRSDVRKEQGTVYRSTRSEGSESAVKRMEHRRKLGFNRRPYYSKKRVCLICQKKIQDQIDYKNIHLLRRFTNDKGKILTRRFTGACAKHERFISKSIKRARMMALLPFVRLD